MAHRERSLRWGGPLRLCRWDPETGEQGLLPAAGSLTTAGAPGQVSGDTREKAPLHPLHRESDRHRRAEGAGSGSIPGPGGRADTARPHCPGRSGLSPSPVSPNRRGRRFLPGRLGTSREGWWALPPGGSTKAGGVAASLRGVPQRRPLTLSLARSLTPGGTAAGLRRP